MRAPILNRSGEPPADGWYQIEVTGEHPAGKSRKQIIDAAALTAIVNRFAQEKEAAGDNWGGLLVDNDHFSHDLDKSTEALAWAQELRVKDGELEARLDLTDLGETAIRNKRFKFFSTEYDPEDLEDLGDGRVRPLRLAGLAFTNRPNNRGGRPISNRADSPEEKPEPQPTMKSIAEKLGLSADADEAAILSKITAIMAENATLKGKQDEDAAEAVMNRFGDRIPEAARPMWRERLIKNRAETEPLMDATIPAVATKPAPRIHNRDGKNSPVPVEKQQGEDADKEAKRGALVDAIRNRRQCTFNEAWQQARAEKPELF